MTKHPPGTKPPRLSVTLTAVERAVLRNLAVVERRSDSFMAAVAIRYWLQVQATTNPDLVGQTRLDLNSDLTR